MMHAHVRSRAMPSTRMGDVVLRGRRLEDSLADKREVAGCTTRVRGLTFASNVLVPQAARAAPEVPPPLPRASLGCVILPRHRNGTASAHRVGWASGDIIFFLLQQCGILLLLQPFEGDLSGPNRPRAFLLLNATMLLSLRATLSLKATLSLRLGQSTRPNEL